VLLTGVAWSLQLVQLPILRIDQLADHRRLNSRLLAGPMTIEFIAAVWLVIDRPGAATMAGLALSIAIGFATYQYSRVHSKSPDVARLKRWNLIRAICWTARSAVLIFLIAG